MKVPIGWLSTLFPWYVGMKTAEAPPLVGFAPYVSAPVTSAPYVAAEMTGVDADVAAAFLKLSQVTVRETAVPAVTPKLL